MNAVDKIIRRSKILRLFFFYGKFTLAAFALILVFAIVLIPRFSEQSKLKFAFQEVKEQAEDLPSRMISPVFKGFTSKNEPYTITAEYGEQFEAEEKIKLKNISATIASESRGKISFTTPDGIYEVNPGILSSASPSEIFDSEGYKATMQGFAFNSKQSSIKGDAKIKIEGPRIELNANSFSATQTPEIVDFAGGVDVEFAQEGGKKTRISSNTLNLKRETSQAIFTGNVVATQDGKKLYANKLIANVDYKAGGKKALKTIDASGNVRLVTSQEEARANRGVFNNKTQKLILTGNVSLIKGGNKLSGGKLIYNLQTGSAVLETKANAGSGKQDGKVKGTFTPSSKDGIKPE